MQKAQGAAHAERGKRCRNIRRAQKRYFEHKINSSKSIFRVVGRRGGTLQINLYID
jgi:hypothetical protein